MEYISNLFKGRLNRRNLLLGLASSMSVLFIFMALATSVFQGTDLSGILGIIWIVLFISAIIFNISLQVRRWHDLGNTGLMVIVNFIPLINIITVLEVFLKAGQPQDNKYGKAPSRKIKYPQDILALTGSADHV